MIKTKRKREKHMHLASSSYMNTTSNFKVNFPKTQISQSKWHGYIFNFQTIKGISMKFGQNGHQR